MHCFFTSDLHGSTTRYNTLYHTIDDEHPDAVFLGGDLLPIHHPTIPINTFLSRYLFEPMKQRATTTKFFVILGNDDPQSFEHYFQDADQKGILTYLHQQTHPLHQYTTVGYACVPPTPFLLKDWERYDVSYDPGLGNIPPEEGTHTVPFSHDDLRHGCMTEDLEHLTDSLPMNKTIILFHSPPYNTDLDRAALDGQMIDHAPLDVHVGSIAIQRFIEKHQPLLTLHGHVHESTRLTGNWKIKIGKTHCFNGSTDGPELALVRFDPAHLNKATRELIA